MLMRYKDIAKSMDVLVVPRGPKWTIQLPDKLPLQPTNPGNASAGGCQMVCSNRLLNAIPNRAEIIKMKLKPMMNPIPFRGTHGLLIPRPSEYYPIPEEALPPGVDPESIITVAYKLDGEVVGGVSYFLSEKQTLH